MSENPHIRNIKLLHPEIDLAGADQPKGTKRSHSLKRPSHPSDGLLDDEEELHSNEPVKKQSPIQKPPTQTAEDLPEIPPAPDTSSNASSEKFSSNAVGGAPEMITGEFPDPIDI